MSFGSCCFKVEEKIKSMITKSVIINGYQKGMLGNYEVTQTFYHSEKEAQEVNYVFPNDHKICIYDTTFIIGNEIIKPVIRPKEEAKKIYEKAIKTGNTAIVVTNIDHGTTAVKIGNIEPNIECKVICKLAFTGSKIKENLFYIKFPLDVYTPYGSENCNTLDSSQFLFQLQCDEEKIARATSNVKNFKFDQNSKIFSINDKIQNDENENSIIITFETNEIIESSCFKSQTDTNYDYYALTISPNLHRSEEQNSEFVFVVDCSGSMYGKSIIKASECLQIFIKSLPPESYFNVIRFGSNYKKLFDTSVIYNEQTANQAIELAQNLQPDLGGTDIYSPLEDIFSTKSCHGQRQVFIITDGEVENVAKVLNLVSSNSNDNCCFSIGIGRGCDAGLIEEIAQVSGGLSDFVQEGDSISEKVIPQLISSLTPSFSSIDIHFSGNGNDSFEISPYPIHSINSNGSSLIYLRNKKQEKTSKNHILITGKYGSQTIEIPIDKYQQLINVEEDIFGCSYAKNLSKAILPLFSFSLIQKLENKQNLTEEDKAKIIELSILSGVLSKFTGFVGMIERPYLRDGPNVTIIYSSCGLARSCRPPVIHRLPWGYSLIRLIHYQKILGNWDDLEAVQNITNVNIDQINEVDLPNKDNEKSCVATIIAIASMRVKSSNEKNSWCMIEQKALAWIKKTLPNIDIEQIISKIETLIKSST